VAELQDLTRLGQREHGLAVVAVGRPDGTVHASVVNAGVCEHPLSGLPVVAFVSRGQARKLALIRAGAAIAVTVRAGWEWVTVEGTAEVAGPDDRLEGLPPDRIPQLLRDVFTAAGGTHDDWDEYDRVMANERRAAVLVRPERVYSNPGSE
jgi:PPOX class probable F420-dependent enzyme